MKKIVLLTFALVLLSTGVFVEFVRPAVAEGTIYVMTDGSVSPANAPILNIGNVMYKFLDNINYSGSESAIVVYRDNIILDGNGFSLKGQGGDAHGIEWSSGHSNITIQNMMIEGFDYGISIFDSKGNTIRGNNIANITGNAIYLWQANHNTIYENNITGSNVGINLNIWKVSDSSYNSVFKNNLANNNVGIVVYSSYNDVFENNIKSNDEGVDVNFSSNNTIYENNIRSNSNGIQLLSSVDCKVYRNNISDNFLGASLSNSSGNLLYHNNFIDNTKQVEISLSNKNIWDDGYPSGGNYWSDYTSVDANGDDIGDEPYIIDSNNRDRYPLMNPWSTITEDFTISVFPTSQSINRGESVTYTVTITSVGGFTSEVSLSGSINPSSNDITSIFNPALVTLPSGRSAQSTLTVETTSNTPVKKFIITITATGGEKTKTTTATVSVEISLEVPYQYQGDTNWCGPTSLSMVLNYYGFTFHPWDYASSVGLLGLGKTEATSVSDLVSFLNKYYPVFNVKIGNYTLEEIQADQNNIVLKDIESNVSSAYPVILSLMGGSFPNIARHFVVVTGYNESGLFINDPSGAFFTDSHYLNKPGHISPYIHEFVKWDDIKMFIQPYEHNPILGDHNTLLCVQNFLANSLSGTVGIEEIHWGSSKIVLDRGMLWMPVGPVKPDDKLGFYLYAYNSRSCMQSFTLSVRIVGDDKVTYSSFEKNLDNIEAYDGIYFYQPGETVDLPTTQYYRLFVELKDAQKNVLDYFVTPKIYYFKSGISVTLKEQQRHLFLHAYDAQGNHVGMNYTTNQTELGIPDSYYFDDLNGTITVILPKITSSYRVVVDATYAEEATETYNLTITVMDNGQIIDQKEIQSTIQKGRAEEYTVEISENGEITIKVPPSEAFPLWIVAVVAVVFIGTAIGATYLWRRRKQSIHTL